MTTNRHTKPINHRDRVVLWTFVKNHFRKLRFAGHLFMANISQPHARRSTNCIIDQPTEAFITSIEQQEVSPAIQRSD